MTGNPRNNGISFIFISKLYLYIDMILYSLFHNNMWISLEPEKERTTLGYSLFNYVTMET